MIDTLKRAFKEFQADEMTDRAAALTYYMMMSLFPALLVGVSLLGLLGDQLARHRTRSTTPRDNGAPAEVTDALEALLTKTVEAGRRGVASRSSSASRSRSTARRAPSARPAAR